MRRTYRSKKDDPGSINHRDVLLASDSKSSGFDAFYIQNLKQTKLEISVGYSRQFAASNKVRKRKYVRRVKEHSPPLRKSACKSAYLTPDKSIHVNRAPDLFDQLLNSSPAETQKSVFDLLKASETRTYKGKEKQKKFNHSSTDSSDSDKENSDICNKTSNCSNIHCHELIIENKNSPKQLDESLNNIINNVSILKVKNEICHSPMKSPIISRVKNRKELVNHKSPLCSTPFQDKYRGKSIYKFSPITLNFDKRIQFLNISEEKKKSNDDISHVPDSSLISNIQRPYEKDKKSNDESKTFLNSLETVNKSICDIYQNTEEPFFGFSNNLQENNKESNTEEEPFFGFSNNLQENTEKSDSICKISNTFCNNVLPSKNSLSFIQIEKEVSTISIHKTGALLSPDTTITSEETDGGSLYDTCSSEESVEFKLKKREPVVSLNRLNDLVFNKYYKRFTSENKSDNNIEDEYVDRDDNDNYNNEEFLLQKSLSKEESRSDKSTSTCYSDLVLDETVISFVTERKRNKVTSDPFILVLDDSVTDNENRFLVDLETNDVPDLKDKPFENALVDETQSQTIVCGEEKADVIDNTSTDKRDMVDSTAKLNPEIQIDSTNELHNIETYSSCSNRYSNFLDKSSIMTRRRARIDEKNKTEVEVLKNISEPKTSLNCTSDSLNSSGRHGIVLQPGKKWERSLSIYRRMTMKADHFNTLILDDENLQNKGRRYRQSVISTMELQDFTGFHNESSNSRRSTFTSKPSRPSIKILKESDISRDSIYSTSVCESLEGFVTEDCDDTVIELSKLSIADCDPEVTVIENVHDTSHRTVTAREYVLRRCDQTDALLFDECYPDTVLKNCRKIGEGVYGEVFLWRARDGRARVLKVIPVGGNIKVNGENQKDFGEIISEIVIAMELSALRAPIADIEQHLDEGKDIDTLDLHSVENATDVFNEVLAVRCVYGSYPSRLLDLWDLYDECKGSENDNPAILPVDQQFIVLELANAGQDLESYHFNNAEQAYSILIQVAYGLAVAEEAFQFEHRDLHWGNILIAPTDEKHATFVLRGRAVRVPRRGVAATVIDYSLSRVSLRPARAAAIALYHDLAADDELFEGRGDYQFELYRLMRRALGNDWQNYEPYTNVLWLHYTADKMITSVRYNRPGTKVHRHHIARLQLLKEQLLVYRSATELVLTHKDL